MNYHQRLTNRRNLNFTERAVTTEQITEENDTTNISLRVYLWSIVRMPAYMWMLCLTHLLTLMALDTCTFFYTDYVGEAVYGGQHLYYTQKVSINFRHYNDLRYHYK